MSDRYANHSNRNRFSQQSFGGKSYNNQNSGQGQQKQQPQSNYNKEQGNNSKLKEITLPYDFISLPSKNGKPEYYYPYHRRNEAKKPPRHDLHEAGHLSGYISYQIKPHSPLVLDLRETSEADGPKEYWLSGSQIRGKLRANVEVLSASYPEFVDDSEMLYRKIAGGKRYKEKIGITDKQGLEQAVRAGYLYRDDKGSFYIIPAVMIRDQHFLSVQELDIINMKSNVLPNSHRLFDWGYSFNGENVLQVMNKFNRRIKELDIEIRELRKQYSLNGKDLVSEYLEKVFKRFAFTENNIGKKISGSEKGIEDLHGNLFLQLKGILEGYDIGLAEKYAERWKLKAHMFHIYELKTPKGVSSFKKNSAPYEKQVKYFLSGKSVTSIKDAASPDPGGSDGVLFNSTNVGSKRSHYLIGEEQENAVRINVPDSILISYKRAYKNIRIGKKNHYDIFNEDGDTSYEKPLVVFYQLEQQDPSKTNDPKDKLVAVGRTPYFKIPYDYQLSELLGEKDAEGIDFASAMFGYVSMDSQQVHDEAVYAYKSRLRFSPIRVCGEIRGEEQEFLLATPQASAEAMYLKSNGREIPTYERSFGNKNKEPNGDAPDSLRGVKYYHVLPKTIPTFPEGSKGAKSNSIRRVYDPSQSPFHCEGKIHFKNLTDVELGLLLLAMNVKLLPDAEKYNIEGKPYYELIGGAKAYGYGKVQFERMEIMLEEQGNSFESLIITPFKASKVDPSLFVKAYREVMKHDSRLEQVDIKRYVQSRIEIEFKSSDRYHVNWSNMNEVRKDLNRKPSGGGYPTDWVLKSTEDK
ncbi:hypothetical protein NST38_31270 [Paenibacillus sp. FSL H8-0104]|uniref:hypothetical protein n=1 Tax=Paenibacillus sp. FSL H8-0104 TaxID=2954509 RepID=UPI0030FD96A0